MASHTHDTTTLRIKDPELSDYPLEDRAPLGHLVRSMTALKYPIIPLDTKIHSPNDDIYCVVGRWSLDTCITLADLDSLFKINPTMVKNVYITCTVVPGENTYLLNLVVELRKLSHFSSTSTYEIHLVQSRLVEKISDFHSDLEQRGGENGGSGSGSMDTGGGSSSDGLGGLGAVKRGRR